MQTSSVRIRIQLAIASIVWIGLGGCAGMVSTPEHVRPDVVAKDTWSTNLSSEYGIDPSWWRAFQDPVLDGLVSRAVEGNLDLQVLAARIDEAGALIGEAKALRLPVVAAGTRTDSTRVTGFDSSTKLGTGAELAWELDVWGKARKGIQAQKAAYQASRADWRAGYIQIVASVVGSYFEVRRLDRQIAQQRRALEQSRRILDIYRKLHHRGLASGTQLSAQEAELYAIRVGLRDLERARALGENAIAALLGTAPGELHLDDTGAAESLPIPEVPAGLPADLLTRRPDLLAAEYRVLQAVNLEGQARLSRLPSIGLTGIGGSASFGLSQLLDTWTAGLSSVVQFPVFDPNVRARIRTSEAQVQVAEQTYRAAVLRAFEEVEAVLINLHSHRQQRADLLQRRGRLEEVDELNRRQLELGLLSHLDVLEQQRSLLAAEQAVIQNEWQIRGDIVALYKALGGGWPPESPAAVVAR